jgi:hypothetical protein
LRNDNESCLSKGTPPLNEKRHIEVPRLNFPAVERDWKGEEVAETTQRDLELVDIKGLGVMFGKLRHDDELDAYMSNHSSEATYKPHPAIYTISPRFPAELCCHHPLAAAEPVQSNDTCCSGMKNVSKHRTVPEALSQNIQVKNSPVVPVRTRSRARNESLDGHKPAVSSRDIRHAESMSTTQQTPHLCRIKTPNIEVRSPIAVMSDEAGSYKSPKSLAYEQDWDEGDTLRVGKQSHLLDREDVAHGEWPRNPPDIEFSVSVARGVAVHLASTCNPKDLVVGQDRLAGQLLAQYSSSNVATHRFSDGGELPVMVKRALELVVFEEVGSVSGKPVHSDRLDAVASSPSWPDLGNGICCSRGKTVSERRAVPLALPPLIKVEDTPALPPPTHSKMCNDIHQQFHAEPRHLHRDGSNMGSKALDKHDDGIVHRRRVDLQRNAHREDVRVGSVNASTWCRGRRGGGVHSRNKHRRMFVCEQQGVLDALASSSDA